MTPLETTASLLPPTLPTADPADLAEAKDRLIDQAYDEFCRREEAGEELDPSQFAARFPRYRTSLCKLLVAHKFLHENPQYLPSEEAIAWPKAGELFLGFDLLRELGRGSFARVFLAQQPALGNRLVAVKISRRGGAEAEILGRLQHPNIVPIHSVEHDPMTGLAAVCMPFLGKATLCDLLDRAFAGPQPPAEARLILKASREGLADGLIVNALPAAILRRGNYLEGVLHLGIELTSALSFVHGQKVFHGDLKPSNILLTPDGRPMLLDFNLSTDEQTLAAPLGGTVPYMSPEQLRAIASDPKGPARPLDARSDLFSLGVILYQLLTGEHPFGPIPWKKPALEVRADLAKRHQQGPTSLRRLNPRIDERVAEAIEKCLAYRPEERFQSAAELERALRAGLSVCHRVRRWLIARPKRVTAVLVLFMMVAVAVGVLRSSQPPFKDRQLSHAIQELNAGHFEQALKHVDRALEEAPGWPKAYFARGRVHQAAGKFELAVADLRAAAQGGGKGQALACLGYAYCKMPTPSWHQAEAAYQNALKEGFDTAEVWNNLGVVHLKLKDLIEAEKALRKAVELDPPSWVPYHNLAFLHLSKNSQSAAYLLLEGVKNIEIAIQKGASNGDVFRNAARLYARSPRNDPQHLDTALSYARKALEHGINPLLLEKDHLLRELHNDGRFRQLLSEYQRLAPGQADGAGTVCFLDPFLDWPD